jgi:hypothetical protein
MSKGKRTHLLGHEGGELLGVNDGAVHLVRQLMEVTHTDLCVSPKKKHIRIDFPFRTALLLKHVRVHAPPPPLPQRRHGEKRRRKPKLVVGRAFNEDQSKKIRWNISC